MMTCKTLFLVLLGCAWLLWDGVSGECKNEANQYGGNPCYTCHDLDGVAVWSVLDCPQPPCTDYIMEPNNCCPTCPNGLSCRAPDGSQIKFGQTVMMRNGGKCKCVQTSMGVNTACKI